MSIRATPVQFTKAHDYHVRGRSGSAEAFRRELSGATSSRRDEISRSSAPPARPAATVTEPVKAAGSAGNPFAATVPVTSSVTPAVSSAETTATTWAPWAGPRDIRDGIPAGGGLLTASGAPVIQINTTPTRNQYNYAGPAALNPYFTNPGNPLREGYVAGFANWFLDSPAILGPGQRSTPANPAYFSTEEGAQEALRLVRQYEPGATLTPRTWGGGPFLSNRPMYFITLPGGQELNAGGILDSYYNHGYGVTIASDLELERTVHNA